MEKENPVFVIDNAQDQYGPGQNTTDENGQSKAMETAKIEKLEEMEDDEESRVFERYVGKVQNMVGEMYHRYKRIFKMVVYIILIILYHAYFVAALIHDYRKAVPLIVFTAIAWIFSFYYYLYVPYLQENMNRTVCRAVSIAVDKIWKIKYVRWVTYGALVLAVVLFLAVDTADNRYRLVSLAGLAAFILIGFLCSTNPARINWRPIWWGLLSQLILALLILRWPPGLVAFMWLSDEIVKFLDYTYIGTDFVYGFVSSPPNICGMSPVFLFSVLQTLVFFASVVAILYYYGIIQWTLVRVAKLMQLTFGTTAAESLFAAACIFLGQSEAVLLIRPYLTKLTKSEYHQLMTSGFACIAGSLFAAYISFGACPIYLLSASIMSAPASLAVSKLFCPETEKSQTRLVEDLRLPKGTESNVIEAIANGACSVIEIMFMIGANLIVFIAIIAFLNSVMAWLGEMVGVHGLSFELIYSYIFFPLALMMGASDNPVWEKKVEETMVVAELIGTKTILNEFIAYKKLGDYVIQGKIGGRAQMITTYALCGFSNVGSVGGQVACLAGMCPEKKQLIASVAVRSLVAGSVACFLTACFAGLLVSQPLLCKPAMHGGNCFNVSAHI